MTPSDSKVRLDEILPEVYADLRAIASRALERERDDHTYQTTELVHEAYVRLAAVNRIDWDNPDHVLRTAVGVIRRLLIDYARHRKALKRNPQGLIAQSEGASPADQDTKSAVDILELEEALEKLKALDTRKAEIVELKYFGGQDIETIARILSVSPATIKREWVLAKAWLARELAS